MSAALDLAASLRALACFSDLAPSDIDALANSLLVQEHPAGHVLIVEGDRADSVYLLLSGCVSVGKQRGQAWEELNRLTAGELFGLVALVDDGPRSASCRAATAITVGTLPRNVFSLLFNTNTPIGLAFQRGLCAQLARDFRHVDRQIQAALASAATGDGGRAT